LTLTSPALATATQITPRIAMANVRFMFARGK
jgi:hypothetical protein